MLFVQITFKTKEGTIFNAHVNLSHYTFAMGGKTEFGIYVHFTHDYIFIPDWTLENWVEFLAKTIRTMSLQQGLKIN